MAAQTTPAGDVPFAEIEREFKLVSTIGRPAVSRTSGGYKIRLLTFRRRGDGEITCRYDAFHTDHDGQIIEAPRRYTGQYRGRRIVGLDEAVARYSGVVPARTPSYCRNGWDQVVPGLWVGGHDKAHPHFPHEPEPVVVDDEFDLVVSLYQRDGHGPAGGVEHHVLSIPDGQLADDDRSRLAELADRAAAAVRDGRRTLVRCQVGLNRGPLLAALVLLRLGHTPADAIDLLRKRRSHNALFNPHFVRHILEENRG